MNRAVAAPASVRGRTRAAGQGEPAAGAGPISTRLSFSVDVEEYFHAEVFAGRVGRDAWPALPRRAEPYVARLADLLERYGSRGTFFVLGWTVDTLAPLLRDLAARGHEIACHGDGHEHLRRLSPQKLRDDLRAARARLEDAIGVRVRGYRAPTFSVTRATAWALDVIAAEAFEYDASIFPVHHDRYGVPDAPAGPFWAVAPGGARLLEFPPLTLAWGRLRVPVGGGGYLRLLPVAVVRRCLAARAARGRAAMIYVHPWELDPGQPRLPAGPLAQWRHRVNLRRTAGKVESLLRRFTFAPAAEVLRRVAAEELPVYAVGEGLRVEGSG